MYYLLGVDAAAKVAVTPLAELFSGFVFFVSPVSSSSLEKKQDFTCYLKYEKEYSPGEHQGQHLVLVHQSLKMSKIKI